MKITRPFRCEVAKVFGGEHGNLNIAVLVPQEPEGDGNTRIIVPTGHGPCDLGLVRTGEDFVVGKLYALAIAEIHAE